MNYRRHRVRVETQRHSIEGVIQLPDTGFRSRTTDFLNAHETDFIALTDATLRGLDGAERGEQLLGRLLVAVRVVAADVRVSVEQRGAPGRGHERLEVRAQHAVHVDRHAGHPTAARPTGRYWSQP